MVWVERNLANLVIVVGLVVAIPALLFAEPDVVAKGNGSTLTEACGFEAPVPPSTEPTDVEVADAGSGERLDLMLPRSGDARTARLTGLAVTAGGLTPSATLATDVTELRRDDGEVLSSSQVRSRALVDRTGRAVSVQLCVDPRLGSVAAAGGYTGAVTLDDPRAAGATVPVSVHVQYPLVERVMLAALLAALGGVIWTWLIRHTDAGVEAELAPDVESAWQTLATRLASLLAAVPVFVAVFYENPDWKGTIGAYVALVTAVGAAVIAAAPTFRALASRVNKTQ